MMFNHNLITHHHVVLKDNLYEEIKRLSMFFKCSHSNVEITIPLPLDNFNTGIIYIKITAYEAVIHQFLRSEYSRNECNKHLEKVLADKIMVEELKEEEERC